MAKRLPHLSWKPKWVTHLGSLKGCLDWLDADLSDAWLYGATGHAFVINVHDAVCPSGPTAWKTEMLYRLGRNVGYEVDGVLAFKSEPDFALKRERAWDHVRAAIDEGVPCYGWELAVPEFYVIDGYDDCGYYFCGTLPEPVPQPKPWNELAETEIGVLEVNSVRLREPADDVTCVREALSFALEHAGGPERWIFPKYHAGLKAYDAWIAALESGKADGFGTAYNAAVWQECRRHAVEFLKEARERITNGSGLFDEAVWYYDLVARSLTRVEELFPFHTRKPEHIEDPRRRENAVEALRAAREAEEVGLGTLARIVEAL